MACFRLSVMLLFFACTNTSNATPSEEDLETMWARFQRDFEQTPSISGEPRRFKAFKYNVMRAIEFNAEQGVNCTNLFDDDACVFGVTKFSNMFPDEFAAARLGYRRAVVRPRMTEKEEDVLPEAEFSSAAFATKAMDWRSKGAVTPVKDQGQCGSCWAFSATEEIESAVFMATGKLPQLSTQQIISCDKEDDGCDGGDPQTAYQYVKQAGGLDTAADYPDKSHLSGRTGNCIWDGTADATVTGYRFATKPCNRGACKHQNEKALAAALTMHGPVSICVNAGGEGWQNYKRGIFSRKCSGAPEALDHCVQLVGFDQTGRLSTHFWWVRNSWGTDWGEKGYMRLKMGKNLCGVADEATLVHASTKMPALTV